MRPRGSGLFGLPVLRPERGQGCYSEFRCDHERNGRRSGMVTLREPTPTGRELPPLPGEDVVKEPEE